MLHDSVIVFVVCNFPAGSAKFLNGADYPAHTFLGWLRALHLNAESDPCTTSRQSFLPLMKRIGTHVWGAVVLAEMLGNKDASVTWKIVAIMIGLFAR